MNLLYAASTQRTIGWVIAVILMAAFVLYVLINVFFTGRREVGSELELAPNRKPYMTDEELETKKLDLTLLAGLGTLAVIALALPLYWLGEPGRQEGFADFTERQLTSRGEELYVLQCSACHGLEGVGGLADFTVADANGRFIAATTWLAPSLDNIYGRFDMEEVIHILDVGRPQSPMPAWGAGGGGPLTTQQLEEIALYLASIQLDAETMVSQVDAGILEAARAKVLELDPDLAAELSAAQATGQGLTELNDRIAELAQAYVDDATPVQLGELLFNNPAGAGSYNCARCHTAGWSWGADRLLASNPEAYEGLVMPQVSGGGGFGPSLRDGATLRQFDNAEAQEAFIAAGCSDGQRYGNNGYCDGGQMPGFGGLLSEEQIAAIVAYERGL